MIVGQQSLSIIVRAVQKTRRLVQPGKPACRPIWQLWRSDAGSELDNPTPCRSVVDFPFQNPWHPNWTKPLSYRRSIMNFRPDSARFHRYLTKSRPDLVGSSQQSFPAMKPDTRTDTTKTDLTWTRKSDQIIGSISSHIFLHPNNSGQVWVRHKPNLARSVDTPNHRVGYSKV